MTNGNDQKVYFKELTDEEKQSKFSQLYRRSEGEITIWLKGKTNKHVLKVAQYFQTKNEVQIIGNIPKDHLNSDVLYSFELNGLFFFSKGKTKSATNEKVYLEVKEKLFKSERRSNFRLLTFPHQQVYIHIQVSEEKREDSNIVSLKTGFSETGLFQNFLKVIGDDGSEVQIDGCLKLRVLDISVTGMAIQMGQIEKDLFSETNKELGPIHLEFNGQMLKIPNAQILYFIDTLAQDKKTKLFKAGVQFLDIDTNLDVKLAKLINQTLRSLESEFEDFLS